MKVIQAEEATLQTSIEAAQKERILITREGKPIAMMIGVSDLDQEQIELGNSDAFWQLITERRAQKTISRAELERRLEQN